MKKSKSKKVSYLCLSCMDYTPCQCVQVKKAPKTKIVKKKVWEVKLSFWCSQTEDTEYDEILLPSELKKIKSLGEYNRIEADYHYRCSLINTETKEIISEWEEQTDPNWYSIKGAPKTVQKAAMHLTKQLGQGE